MDARTGKAERRTHRGPVGGRGRPARAPLGTRRGSKLVITVVLATVFALVAPAGAAPSAYPDPPPQLPHSHPRHGWYFNDLGFPRTVPLLVVVPFWDDAPLPATHDEPAEIAARFFGPFPSVAAYWDEASRGQVRVVPARESQGTADDGVIIVRAGPRIGDYLGLPRHGDFPVLIPQIDPFVDFSTYDTLRENPFVAGSGSDGQLGTQELSIIVARAPRPGFPDNGGQVGHYGGSHDGVLLNMRIARNGARTNIITHAHELSHQVLEHIEGYGNGVGSLDIGGPTVVGPEVFFVPGAPQQAHWGWVRPQVITRDGWVEVPPLLSDDEPRVLGLYDPKVGTDEHLLVENRARPPGVTGPRIAADANASDRGLVIWQMREHLIDWPGAEPPPEVLRSAELVLPRGTRSPGCLDEDVDGLVDEDPEMSPRVPLWYWGLVDWNRDRRVDAGDTVSGPAFMGYPLVEGQLDLNGDGRSGRRSDGGDTGEVFGVPIIDGRIDATGSGAIELEDDFDPWTRHDNDGDGLIDEDTADPNCDDGSDLDAWDPSDPRTPQRTFEGRLPSGHTTPLAVRNVWPPDPDTGAVRAFMDVVGPGVLIDLYEAADALRLAGRPTLFGGAWQPVPVLVRNTSDIGDAARTFEARLETSEGWRSRPARVTLAPQTQAVVEFMVRPAPRAHRWGRLDAFVRATDDPSLASDSSLQVFFASPDRDRDEPNDTAAAAIPLERAHAHGIVHRLGGRTERWSALRTDLNLHDAHDEIDHYTFALPDHGDPGHGGHPDLAGLPACGTVTRDGKTLVVTSRLEARALPEPGVPGARVTIAGATTRPDGSVRLTCPGTPGDEVLLRVDGDHVTGYILDVRYEVDVSVVPEQSSWVRDVGSEDYAAFARIPCPGGWFPACASEQPGIPVELGLAHPADPRQPCDDDGCASHAQLAWPGTGAFSLAFKAPATTQAHLLDAGGKVLAASVVDPEDQSQNWLGAEGAPAAKPGGADAMPHRLDAGKLPAGTYFLRVSGPAAGDLAARTTLPSPALTATLETAGKAVPEPGGLLDRVVHLTNTQGELPVTVDALSAATDCQLPLTLDPGETARCAAPAQVAGEPGTVDLAVEAAVTLGKDVPVTGTAAGATEITDLAPVLSASFSATPPPPDAEGGMKLTLELGNQTAEAADVHAVNAVRWIDADGDGIREETELQGEDWAEACGLPVTLAAGKAVTCTASQVVAGPPWAPPQWEVGVAARDDEGNAWGAVARAAAPPAQAPPAKVIVERARAVRAPAQIVEDTTEGLSAVPRGSDDLVITLDVRPEGGPALVTDVSVDLGGAGRACIPVGDLPRVVAEPATLSVICALAPDARAGLLPTVRLGLHGTVSGPEVTVPEAGTVVIDVRPGDDANTLPKKGKGKVPIAVLSHETFDATTVRVTGACFGPVDPSARDCTESHGKGHPEDVDGDGDIDLVLHYDAGQMTFPQSATAVLACLSATTTSGAAFDACDVMRAHEGKSPSKG